MVLMVNLIPGKKYTFVGFSEFGFPLSIQFVLNEIQIKKYAQYENIPHLIIRPKKCRSLRVKRIFPEDKFIIWEGWINPNVNMWDTSDKNGFAQSKFISFSDGYLKEALTSVEQNPILAKVS